MRANKYEKINELMPDIKMSSANAFVSHAINSAFIPWPVPLCYIVDYKEKYIHTIYLPSSAYFRSSDISVTYARILTLSRSSEC